MKKHRLLAVSIALSLIVLMLSACGGKSEFGLSENTGESMTITAKNAEEGASFVAGALEAEEDLEHIVISADLDKGSIRVEIFEAAAEQSMDELPDTESTPVLTANLKTTEGCTGGVPAGSNILKATCLEKATGTVHIVVKPPSE